MCFFAGGIKYAEQGFGVSECRFPPYICALYPAWHLAFSFRHGCGLGEAGFEPALGVLGDLKDMTMGAESLACQDGHCSALGVGCLSFVHLPLSALVPWAPIKSKALKAFVAINLMADTHRTVPSHARCICAGLLFSTS